MKTHFVAIALACVVVAGCQTTTVAPLPGTADAKIPGNARIYLATPQDGRYGDTVHSGSGHNVAQVLASAFHRHAGDVTVGKPAASVSDALEAAREAGGEFLAYPIIAHWEDRATEWSGRRDRLTVLVKVYRVSDGSQIRAAEIDGKSSWFTMGGDRPQDLLAEPLLAFVATLY